jgi:hypothetical protein
MSALRACFGTARDAVHALANEEKEEASVLCKYTLSFVSLRRMRPDLLDEADAEVSEVAEFDVGRGVERVPLAEVCGAGAFVAELAADDVHVVDEADALEVVGPGSRVDRVGGGDGFHLDDEAGFFLDFANDRGLGVFAEIQATAGESPEALPLGEVLREAAEEDTIRIVNEGVGRDAQTLGFTVHGAEEMV